MTGTTDTKIRSTGNSGGEGGEADAWDAKASLAPARVRQLLELAAADLGVEPGTLDRAIWLHESPSEPGPSRIGESFATAP
ncbi:hypothetical protein M1D88_07230 [Arthrobacter sp. R1-13]